MAGVITRVPLEAEIGLVIGLAGSATGCFRAPLEPFIPWVFVLTAIVRLRGDV